MNDDLDGRNEGEEGMGGLDDDDGNTDMIVIQINNDVIKHELFLYVLQFLYTGTCDVKKVEAEELSTVAERLWLDELVSFCKNIISFDDPEECKVFNSSLSTYWIDSVGHVIKKWYFEDHYKNDFLISITYDEHFTGTAVVIKENEEKKTRK